MTKVMVLISTLLLSACKDNQVKDNNQTPIETTKDKTISYEPNTQELGIIGKYHIKVIPNNNGTYLISSTIDSITIDLSILQDYCNNNGMNHLIITEDNKIEVVEAIVAMQLKDKLAAEGKEDLGLSVFNSINQSDSENILNGCYNNKYHDEESQSEIVTDNMQDNNTQSKNTLSIEDQYVLAEEKQNDITLTEQERKKRSEKYNRLSTEIFKLTPQEMISISDY